MRAQDEAPSGPSFGRPGEPIVTHEASLAGDDWIEWVKTPPEPEG